MPAPQQCMAQHRLSFNEYKFWINDANARNIQYSNVWHRQITLLLCYDSIKPLFASLCALQSRFRVFDISSI